METESKKKDQKKKNTISDAFQDLGLSKDREDDTKGMRDKLSRYMEKKVLKKEPFGAERRLKRKKENKNVKPEDVLPVDVPKEHLERTVYIGNLPGTIITKDLYKDLMVKLQDFGEISSIKYKDLTTGELKKISQLLKGKTRDKDRLIVYVTFKSKESVEKLHQESGSVWFGRHINIDKCGREGAYNVKKCIFVGNLSYDVEDEDLWELFGKYGELKLIRVIRDKNTHKSKGFAYVHYKEKNGLENLIQGDSKNKVLFGGRILRISRAKKQRKKQ